MCSSQTWNFGMKYILCFLSILCLAACTKFPHPTRMSIPQIQKSDLLPTHTPVPTITPTPIHTTSVTPTPTPLTPTLSPTPLTFYPSVQTPTSTYISNASLQEITATNISSLERLAVYPSGELLEVDWSPSAPILFVMLSNRITAYDSVSASELWSASNGSLMQGLESNQTGDRLVIWQFDPVSTDKRALILETVSGNEINYISLGCDYCLSVASPDGRLIAVNVFSSPSNAIWIISTDTGERIDQFDVEAAPASSHLAFSPDGNTLAISDLRKGIFLLDLPTRTISQLPIQVPNELKAPNELAFSPDGQKLAIGTQKNGLSLWDLGESKLTRLRNADSGFLYARGRVRFSSTGDMLLSAWQPANKLEVWDLSKKTLLKTLETEAPIQSFSLSPDDKFVAIVAGAKLRIWDLANEKIISLTDYDIPKYLIGISPDGCCVALAGETLVQFRDIATWQVRSQIKLPSGSNGSSLAIDNPWNLIAVSLKNGDISLINVATGQVKKTLVGQRLPAYRLIFSPNGRQLATYDDSGVWLWDIVSNVGKVVNAGDAAKALGFSLNGEKLFSQSFSSASVRISVLDTSSYEQIQKIDLNRNYGPDIALFEGGDVVITHNFNNGTFVVQNINSQMRRAVLPGAMKGGYSSSPMAVSPDSQLLAAETPGGLAVYNINGSRLLLELPSTGIRSIIFLPDGKLLLVSNQIGIELWAIKKGQGF